MLQTQTVSPELLELLEVLMKIDEFRELRLVGGTALSLQIGHRNSIDIDLFGKLNVDDFKLTEILSSFHDVQTLTKTQNIKIFSINGVKVDFVNYPYPWLKSPIIKNEIRIATKEDIAAMKIAAITQRGSKKDFIDLYFLLKDFSINEIFEFFEQKIFDGNSWMALRSMTFFEDANQQPMPKMYIDISWDEIKRTILRVADDYQNSL